MHAITYLTALGFWPVLQLVACLVIAVALLAYRRRDSQHRRFIAWLSYVLIVSNLAQAIKLALSIKPPPGPLEALLSLGVAVVLVIHRGDLAHALRAPRRALEALGKRWGIGS